MADKPRERHHLMLRAAERFEQAIVIALLAVMMLAIVLSTVDLGWTLVKEMLKPPRFLIEVNEIMQLFGLVFTILIGLELLETIKTYLTREQLHVEIVFLVAMIAVARKVIILEIKEVKPVILLGIAAIILALAAGFLFVKLAYRQDARRAKKPQDAPRDESPPA